MPELPEVEAARRSIERNCIGKTIKRSIIADDPKVIHGVSPSDFEASLLGKTIVAVHRKGKNMWLQLDSPPFPSFQFGMAGAMYIKGVAITNYKRSAVNDTDEWPSKYSKLFIELDDGLELSFTDKRRFAKVRLLENPASVPPISVLGPDALLEPMNIDEFIDYLSKKKIGIKALLLDQSFISGIGNWIADEVLYQAMIHPLQIVSSLSKESCVALHECINKVIRYAVEVDADCNRFPIEWLFHFRWGKRPGQVNGKKIEFIVAGGRTTAYVSEVQKLSGSQAAKTTNKPRKQTVKKCNDKDSEDECNGPESEDKENARSVKSEGGRNTTSCGRKASPTERKLNGSNKDDDDDADRKKKTRTSKNPSARRKPKKTIKRKKNGRKKLSKDRQSQERDGDSGWKP